MNHNTLVIRYRSTCIGYALDILASPWCFSMAQSPPYNLSVIKLILGDYVVG